MFHKKLRARLFPLFVTIILLLSLSPSMVSYFPRDIRSEAQSSGGSTISGTYQGTQIFEWDVTTPNTTFTATDSGQFSFTICPPSSFTCQENAEGSGTITVSESGGCSGSGSTEYNFTFGAFVDYNNGSPNGNLTLGLSGEPVPSSVIVQGQSSEQGPGPNDCGTTITNSELFCLWPVGFSTPYNYGTEEGFNISSTSGSTENFNNSSGYGDDNTCTGSVTIGGAQLQLEISGHVGSLLSCKPSGQVGAWATIASTECIAPHSLVAVTMYKDLAPTLDPLSVSKPDFEQVVSTDDNANFTITLNEPGPLPPDIVVVSTLWYEKNTFAITNGLQDSSGNLVPLYLTACVGNVTLGCIVWESNGQNSYKATVDFTYGTTKSIIQDESWQLGPATSGVTGLMGDGIAAYFYSYEAIQYYDGLGLATLNPVSVSVGARTDPACVTSSGENAFYSSVAQNFGDIGQGQLGAVTGSGGHIVLCDVNSNPFYPDAPMNEEWHEFSHYFIEELGADPLPSCGANWNVTCGQDHAGFINPRSTWGLQEAYAEFGAMMIAENYGDPKPTIYPTDSSAQELNVALWRIYGNHGVTLPCNNYCTFSNSTPSPPGTFYDGDPPVSEEFTIASILWEVHSQLGVSGQQIFGFIQSNKPTNLYQLYVDLSANYDQNQIQSFFINCGVYNNTRGDFVYHSISEIGYTGDPRPGRQNREDPIMIFRADAASPTLEVASNQTSLIYGSSLEPDINGSYLVASSNEILNISIVFSEQNLSSYDYSYTVNATSGQPFYFTMPLSSSPSHAIIYQLSGNTSNQLETINSSDYWNYIYSGPASNAVYLTISHSGASNSSSSSSVNSTSVQTNSNTELATTVALSSSSSTTSAESLISSSSSLWFLIASAVVVFLIVSASVVLLARKSRKI